MDELVFLVTMPDGEERRGFAFRGRVIAGRHETSDLQLSHPNVSRRHAEFSLRSDGSILIRDLGSSNGTTVGRTLLTGDEISVAGDVDVSIGPYKIHVSVSSDSSRATMVDNKARSSPR